MQEEEKALEAELVARVREQPRPKGLGEVTLVTLDGEMCDWGRFHNRKQIGSYTGCCPGEHSSGGKRLVGSIDRMGNGRVRTLLVEAVWRFLKWQPGWKAAHRMKVKLVRAALGDQWQYRRTETVGPKVGEELKSSALWASICAMLGIMAYVWFRYEWQFGVNCLVALAHDCITTVGLFALIGWQFDLTTVAAVLTIAGYSVNDTVVIYDRIREELRRYKKMPLGELLSMSINHTLSRTVMTSGLTLLSVIAILLFGGEVLRGFSLAMTWGIVAGTYSTICVASPMLIYMNLRREKVGSIKPDAEKAASRP